MKKLIRYGRITIVEVLVCIGIVSVLGCILVPGCAMLGGTTGIGKDYSNGVRAGKLIKVSRKGIFYKSYEAELQLVDSTVIGSGSGAGSTPFGYWGFSTANEELGKSLETAVGKTVKITYTQYVIKPISHSTDYECVGFDILEQ